MTILAILIGFTVLVILCAWIISDVEERLRRKMRMFDDRITAYIYLVNGLSEQLHFLREAQHEKDLEIELMKSDIMDLQEIIRLNNKKKKEVRKRI